MSNPKQSQVGKGSRAPGADPDPADESPGLPGFRTWNGVYLFVFVVFILVVVGLSVFTSILA